MHPVQDEKGSFAALRNYRLPCGGHCIRTPAYPAEIPVMRRANAIGVKRRKDNPVNHHDQDENGYGGRKPLPVSPTTSVYPRAPGPLCFPPAPPRAVRRTPRRRTPLSASTPSPVRADGTPCVPSAYPQPMRTALRRLYRCRKYGYTDILLFRHMVPIRIDGPRGAIPLALASRGATARGRCGRGRGHAPWRRGSSCEAVRRSGSPPRTRPRRRTQAPAPG
jgi:hypothetical protein